MSRSTKLIWEEEIRTIRTIRRIRRIRIRRRRRRRRRRRKMVPVSPDLSLSVRVAGKNSGLLVMTIQESYRSTLVPLHTLRQHVPEVFLLHIAQLHE